MTLTPEGTHNFRDTGGTPLASGGVTRSGVLFRSDALNALTPAGLDALTAGPIGVVVDFRTPTEKHYAPDILPTARPVEVVELPVLEGALADAAQEILNQNPSPALIEGMLARLPSLGDLYIGMLARSASHFVEAARLVARSTDDTPSAVLLHCTAGKDRTGVATALLLDAVGAERAAVVADYAASADNLAGEWADGILDLMRGFGIPLSPALIELATGAPPAAIEQAFAWLDAEHGSSTAYLRAAGLTEDESAALRARLRS